MKLALVTDCVSRHAGGLFHSVRRLAIEVERCQVAVQVFGLRDDLTEEDLSEWQPLIPQVLPLRGPRFFGYAPSLKAMLQAYRPDVIQIHGLWKYTSLAVLQASRKLDCPYIVHPHGMLDPWAVGNARWKKQLALWLYERRHLHNASCLRALNESEYQSIRTFGLGNPVCIIPNAIDLPSHAGQSTTSEHPFPADLKVVLFLGRIHPKKGLPNLIDAWAKCQQTEGRGRKLEGGAAGQRCADSSSGQDWLLAIAGWDQGGHEAELQRQVKELGFDAGVVFLGPKFDEQKAVCLRHCDAFVLPSFSEGLPMAVLEAWSYGKPVMMTRQCNLPEGFSAEAAIEIRPSVDSIATGLRAMFAMSDSDRSAMGTRGHALVRQRFTWTEVARQMREVYQWLLGGGAAPDCVRL